MRHTVLLAVSCAALVACATTPVPTRAPGESFFERKVVPIEAAESLAVEGPFKVLVFGDVDAPDLTLSGPPEMIADTRVVMEDGTLSIAFVEGAEWQWNTGAGMHAVVKLPNLNSVALQGSGSIELMGAKADTFSAGAGGSGSITITRLEASEVNLGVGGAGSVTAQGTATTATYGVGGSGSVHAKELRVKTAQIGVGGSGSIYADVSESAEIGVGGSGRVDVVGGAECEFDEAQAAQIECR